MRSCFWWLNPAIIIPDGNEAQHILSVNPPPSPPSPPPQKKENHHRLHNKNMQKLHFWRVWSRFFSNFLHPKVKYKTNFERYWKNPVYARVNNFAISANFEVLRESSQRKKLNLLKHEYYSLFWKVAVKYITLTLPFIVFKE